MKLTIPFALIFLLMTGCQNPDRIEMDYGLSDIRLNGKPMTLEEIEYYTESESKRKTELLITLEDGTVERMTLGEFIDGIEKLGPIESTPAAHDYHMPSGPTDPFAPIKN